MADLLIRGMEMPERCCVCRLCADGWCYALDDHIARLFDRPDRCPLVELPDHGRLIDADAFAAKYVAALPDALANLNDPKNIPMMTAIIQALLLDIAEADTIIPASKEGGE